MAKYLVIRTDRIAEAKRIVLEVEAAYNNTITISGMTADELTCSFSVERSSMGKEEHVNTFLASLNKRLETEVQVSLLQM